MRSSPMKKDATTRNEKWIIKARLIKPPRLKGRILGIIGELFHRRVETTQGESVCPDRDGLAGPESRHSYA